MACFTDNGKRKRCRPAILAHLGAPEEQNRHPPRIKCREHAVGLATRAERRFLASPCGRYSTHARVTTWRRAGLRLQPLPRSLMSRVSLWRPCPSLGHCLWLSDDPELKAKLLREGAEHGLQVERTDDGCPRPKFPPHPENEVMVVELQRSVGPGHVQGGDQGHLVVKRLLVASVPVARALPM